MLDKNSNQGGTVGKALAILDVVESFGTPVRFNDILAKSPYPKASTYRFLQTLTQQSMLHFEEETGLYSLGSRLVRLAHSAWRQASLAPIAARYLDRLSAMTSETIHLAQLDGAQVLYLDKRNANRPIEMFSDAGKIGPAYCTGVGKAMLAFLCPERQKRIVSQQSFYRYTEHTITQASTLMQELAEIQKIGVAFDRGEHEANIICIAAPILTPNQRVIGGISITGSLNRMTVQTLEGYSGRVQETARQIGNDAAQWMFPHTEGK